MEDLEEVYGDPAASREDKITRRQGVFDRHLRRFREEIRPRFLAFSFSSFETLPLNNATLAEPDAVLPPASRISTRTSPGHGGSLAAAIEAIKAQIHDIEDPFELLR